jgi:hypothetical protein
MYTSIGRDGRGVEVSSMMCVFNPGVHMRTSFRQFRTTDAGQTTRAGRRRPGARPIQESEVAVFPVPGALAIKARKPFASI